MKIRLILLAAGLATGMNAAQAFNFMNPGDWFGNDNDYHDRYYYDRYYGGYGPYGPGPYGGWGGPYGGYGGYGGYGPYGGWGGGYPPAIVVNPPQSSSAPAAPKAPE